MAALDASIKPLAPGVHASDVQAGWTGHLGNGSRVPPVSNRLASLRLGIPIRIGNFWSGLR